MARCPRATGHSVRKPSEIVAQLSGAALYTEAVEGSGVSKEDGCRPHGSRPGAPASRASAASVLQRHAAPHHEGGSTAPNSLRRVSNPPLTRHHAGWDW